MTTMAKTKEHNEVETSQHETENARAQQNTFVPGTDVVDSEEKVEILVEMPGADKESVDISLKENILTLEDRVRNTAGHDGYSLLFSEFPVDNFSRTFTLSHEFEMDNIQARMKEGVLSLTLPKRKEKEEGPRKINVVVE